MPPTPVPMITPVRSGSAAEAALAVETAGVGHGLLGGHRRELGEAVDPPDFLRAVQRRGVEVAAHPARPGRCRAQQAVPEGVPADAAGRHHADAGHHDPAALDALAAVG